MAMIYTVLEVAGSNGEPTGKFRHVCYSDEAADPIYQRIIDKTYDSREEAENCPAAKDALDRIFHRGKYLPLSDDERLILELGSALAKARRALRLAEEQHKVLLHIADDAEFKRYSADQSAADVGCASYYGWREQRGLLTDGERETRNVDPDAQP